VQNWRGCRHISAYAQAIEIAKFATFLNILMDRHAMQSVADSQRDQSSHAASSVVMTSPKVVTSPPLDRIPPENNATYR
jgi:hypothetical protein